MKVDYGKIQQRLPGGLIERGGGSVVAGGKMD
jgi:hypothetical protein